MTKKKKSSKLAVIIITIIIELFILLWAIGCLGAFIVGGMALIIFIPSLLICVGLAITIVCVAFQRIKELNGGIEDDISKY